MSAAVVVTGATGWLGGRLVRALVEGLEHLPHLTPSGADLEIRCLLLPGDRAELLSTLSSRVRIHRGDIRDAESLTSTFAGAKAGTLFHCAGVIHPHLRTRDFFEVNVRGTRNVLAAAAAHGIERAVVVSSNSPLGFNPSPDHRFDEQSAYRPGRGYGKSKMLMELAVAEYQQRGLLETVIVRAPWFYGPGQPRRQTDFFTLIRKGAFPLVGTGENLRSMVYVDNLCQGLLLCAQSPRAPGETYWIADQRPYSMNEIVSTIRELMISEFGRAAAKPRLRLPGWVSDAAGLTDDLLQRAGLYSARLHVLSELGKTIACSIDKARRTLGYEPEVDLAEGMRRSLRWCLEQGIEF